MAGLFVVFNFLCQMFEMSHVLNPLLDTVIIRWIGTTASNVTLWSIVAMARVRMWATIATIKGVARIAVITVAVIMLMV